MTKMLRAAYFRVFVVANKNNQDTRVEITDFISELTYTRALKEDNKATFVFETEMRARESLLVVERLKQGQVIEFLYGYLGEQKTDYFKVRITDVKISYLPSMKIAITALDFGNALKDRTASKIWKGKTLSQIAQEIAKLYGLKFEGNPTTYVYACEPQNNRTDLGFLYDLAKKENILVWVQDDTLFLGKRNLEAAPTVGFDYFGGSLLDISFENSSSKNKRVAKRTTAINPETGEPISVEKDKSDKSLGKKVILDPNGNILETVKDAALGFLNAKEERVDSADKDAALLEGENTERQEYSQLDSIVAKVSVQGLSFLQINSIVQLSGFLELHNGNYLVEKITDTLSAQGGFVTSFEARRNATNINKATFEDANKPNLQKTQTTAGEGTKQKKVVIIDPNGNIL